MPARKSTPTGSVTIAFIGAGEVSSKNAKALLQDQVDAVDGNARFIFPVTEEHWTDSLDHVAQFAIDNEIPYECVVVDEKLPKDLEEFVGDAVRSHKVARVPAKLVSLLKDAPNPKLFVLWSDDDPECEKAFSKADDEGIESFDLTNGLDKLEFEEGGAAADEEPEEAPISGGDDASSNGGEAPEDEDEPYTEEELDALGIDDLKKEAARLKIDVPARSRSGTYVKLILAAYKGEAVDQETGEVAPREDEPDDEDEVAAVEALSRTAGEEEYEAPVDDEEPFRTASLSVSAEQVVERALAMSKKAPADYQRDVFHTAVQLIVQVGL